MRNRFFSFSSYFLALVERQHGWSYMKIFLVCRPNLSYTQALEINGNHLCLHLHTSERVMRAIFWSKKSFSYSVSWSYVILDSQECCACQSLCTHTHTHSFDLYVTLHAHMKPSRARSSLSASK